MANIGTSGVDKMDPPPSGAAPPLAGSAASSGIEEKSMVFTAPPVVKGSLTNPASAQGSPLS